MTTRRIRGARKGAGWISGVRLEPEPAPAVRWRPIARTRASAGRSGAFQRPSPRQPRSLSRRRRSAPVAAGDPDRARLVAIVSGEAQQGGMEADRRAVPFQHGAFEIVIKEDTRNAMPCGEGSDMTAQEVLHPGVCEEAQEDLA